MNTAAMEQILIRLIALVFGFGAGWLLRGVWRKEAK